MSSGWGLVAAVAIGLVISEFSELSPWLAHKLILWAARVLYPTRLEELSALIAERPGKLFKLVTASAFACVALTYRVTHRKTVPVRSVTSRLWIGLGSALVAGVLLTGEVLLAREITSPLGDSRLVVYMWELPYLEITILGAIAAFITATELLVPSRLPTGWATAIVSFAMMVLIFGLARGQGLFPRMDLERLISVGGMAIAAGASAACAIRLGNGLRFSITAALSTILGSGLLTLSMIFVMTLPSTALVSSSRFLTVSTGTSPYVSLPVNLLGFGFAFGFSAGVGVLLWRALCGRSSPERVPHAAT